MGKVVVTARIMPESPEADLQKIQDEALKIISDFTGGAETRVKLVPIAFGLQAVDITFLADEEKGSVDALEEPIVAIEHVKSFDVTDVRRAVG